MEMYRRTWAEVNLSNIEFNVQQIVKEFPDGTFFCPMVKANAYGHGDVKVAQFLETLGVQHLGVCLIEEGLLLRQLGVITDILVFRGFDARGAQKMIDSRLTPVVSTWEQLEILIAMKQRTKIHLKFDTGMNRLGFEVAEVADVLEKFKSQTHLQLEGVLTHLYQSEDGMNPNGETAEQIGRFFNVVEVFKNHAENFHVLNSGGIVCKMSGAPGLISHFNWGIRPGLLIYGYNPVANSKFEFKPAMTLQSQTSLVRHVEAGEGVSYGHTWKALRDSQIAVVPIGYADGWHRFLSNRGEVLWNGVKAPIVGNICMDYLMVDVTDLPREKENEVVFFGRSKSGAEILASEPALKAQTITWEMLTSVSERVPRVYTSNR
jgi:alanine racemase